MNDENTPGVGPAIIHHPSPSVIRGLRAIVAFCEGHGDLGDNTTPKARNDLEHAVLWLKTRDFMGRKRR